MRHGKKFNHLGRKAAHRKALLRNLAIALVEHKRIETTLAKAKALRQFIEPLVTKGKTNTMHSRRVVFSYLQNKETVKEIFGAIAEKVGDVRFQDFKVADNLLAGIEFSLTDHHAISPVFLNAQDVRLSQEFSLVITEAFLRSIGAGVKDRKSVVKGKWVELGGRRIMKKKRI